MKLTFNFTHRIIRSQSAAAIYCAKLFPFIKRSVLLFVTVPAVAMSFFIVLGSSVWLPLYGALARALNLTAFNAPLIGGLIIGGLIFAVLRLLGVFRKKYVLQNLARAVPETHVKLVIDENSLHWSWDGGHCEVLLNSIYAIVKSSDGLMLGMGTAFLLLPRDAFNDADEMGSLGRFLLGKMKPEAVSRSSV